MLTRGSDPRGEMDLGGRSGVRHHAGMAGAGPGGRGWRIAGAVALLAAAALPYLRTPANGFVWDDFETIVRNADVHSLENLGEILTTPDLTPPYFRPLTRALFALEWEAFGATPAAFHAVSVVLHAGAVLAVWLLARRLLGREAPALLVAGLFAVHPANAEAVAFVSANNNVLATLFAAAAVLAAHGARGGLRDGRAWASAALALAALGSKETGAVALVLVPLVGPAPGRPRTWLRYAPWVAALGLYLAWWAVSLGGLIGTPTMVHRHDAGPFAALWAFGTALRYAVWPSPLTALHAVPAAGAGTVAAATFAVLAFAGVAVAAARRGRRTALAGLVWFAAALAPSLGAVAIPSVAFAERYLYLALPGLLVALADLVPWARLAARPAPARAAVAAVAAAVLVLAGTRTAARVPDWRDNRTLFTRAVDVAPHPTAHFNLGNDCLARDDLPGAVAHWERAVALDPGDADALTQLGVAAAVRGRLAEAKGLLERALAADPAHPEARRNLDRVLRDLRRPRPAR